MWPLRIEELIVGSRPHVHRHPQILWCETPWLVHHVVLLDHALGLSQSFARHPREVVVALGPQYRAVGITEAAGGQPAVRLRRTGRREPMARKYWRASQGACRDSMLLTRSIVGRPSNIPGSVNGNAPAMIATRVTRDDNAQPTAAVYCPPRDQPIAASRSMARRSSNSPISRAQSRMVCPGRGSDLPTPGRSGGDQADAGLPSDGSDGLDVQAAGQS